MALVIFDLFCYYYYGGACCNAKNFIHFLDVSAHADLIN